MKVVHAAMFHRSDDVRIYVKECCSLAKNGYNVTYVTSKTEGAVAIPNCDVKVIEMPISRKAISRLKHPIKAKKNRVMGMEVLLDIIASEDPDIIHVHEHNLLRDIIILANNINAKIIYDIHEDVPRQQFDKYRKANIMIKIAKAIEMQKIQLYENRLARKCDALITATPAINERFLSVNSNSICIPNYPVLDDSEELLIKRNGHVCYIGMISEQRGIIQVVDALEGTEIYLDLVGEIAQPLLDLLKSRRGWNNVIWHGYKTLDQASRIRNESSVGIVTFLPAGNHIRSLPNKIFEYMASGLTVVASDFPDWEKIVVGNDCGLCVNSKNPQDIQDALVYLLSSPKTLHRYGKSGYNAVRKKYNWTLCEKKLLEVYQKVLGV